MTPYHSQEGPSRGELYSHRHAAACRVDRNNSHSHTQQSRHHSMTKDMLKVMVDSQDYSQVQGIWQKVKAISGGKSKRINIEVGTQLILLYCTKGQIPVVANIPPG